MKLRLPEGMIQSKRGIEGLKPDLSNQDSAQYLALNGKKANGTFFNASAGTTTHDVKLTGVAKLLLGFTIDTAKPGSATTYFTLKINNEIIIDSAAVRDFTNDRQGYAKDFYEYIRQLNGSDNIKIEYTTPDSVQVRFTFYYI